jgi:TonB family protein
MLAQTHNKHDGPTSETATDKQERSRATAGKTDDSARLAAPDLLAENDDTPSKHEEEKNAAAPPIEEKVGKEVPNAVADATSSEELKKPDASVAAEGAALAKSADEKGSLRRDKDSAKKKRESNDKAVSQPGTARALQSPTMPLKGKVVSAEDGEGLPGVTVIVKGTAIGSVTDANGNYKIDLPSLDSQLLFSFVGFETKEVDVRGQPHIDVQLNEDTSQLNEVIVTGYGSTSNETVEQAAAFHPAEPQGGKSAFKKNLLQSLRYPDEALTNKAEGKVTVRFTVQPDGALTGFEVVKGIGFGCDEELIRLIKNGPAWKPAMQGDKPVVDKVKVRFKFELPK